MSTPYLNPFNCLPIHSLLRPSNLAPIYTYFTSHSSVSRFLYRVYITSLDRREHIKFSSTSRGCYVSSPLLGILSLDLCKSGNFSTIRSQVNIASSKRLPNYSNLRQPLLPHYSTLFTSFIAVVDFVICLLFVFPNQNIRFLSIKTLTIQLNHYQYLEWCLVQNRKEVIIKLEHFIITMSIYYL